MSEIRVRRTLDDNLDAVALDNPFPVSVENSVGVASKVYATPYVTIPDIGTASAYTAADAFGGKFIFIVPSEGIIETAIMLDLDDEGINTELWLFNHDFTATADNAAFAVSDGDLANLEVVISITNFVNAANNQVGIANNLSLPYTAPSGSLWGQCVTRGAPNIAAANIPKIALRILGVR